MSDWFDDVAFPLHSALDEATDMDGASVEDRWKLVMERCPWLTLRVMSAGAPVGPPEADGWTSLKSSNIDAVRVVGKMAARPDGTVDPWAHDIEVRFKNGGVYRYTGVKQDDVDGLLGAESPGGYFLTWIKGRYPSEKVE